MNNAQQGCTKCGELLTPFIPTVACGSNCHECGKYRYRADQLSYLYLLTHQQLKLHKIGIGTVGKDKGHLEQLIGQGWTVHGLWHESDKRATFQWERTIFEQLEIKLSLVAPRSPGFIGKLDKHWVESISAKAISVSVLAQLISTIVARKT
jgi:hypothetical protein